MGTEIERRGLALDLPLWSARALLERPDLVLEIHRDNVAAGADILTANTFRTQRGSLESAGLGNRAAELTRAAVSIARQAADEAGRPVWVAGSAAPLADCYRPDLVADRAVLEREHAAHVENLLAAGVDFVLVETMNTIREAQAAAGAVRGGAPVIVSFVTDGRGSLLSGEPLEDAVRAILPLRPFAVGVNCVPASRVRGEVERIQASESETAVAAYANVLSDPAPPEEYAALAAEWLRGGARVVGGCCGTTPAHVAALGPRVASDAGSRR